MTWSKEDVRIARAFRVMKGGKDNLGVKNPWWTREYGDVEGKEWFVAWEVTDAEWIVLDVVNRLSGDEKRMVIVRYGKGRVVGYRKCGKELGIRHWEFFERFQPVMRKLKKYLDEKPLLGQ